VLLEKKTTEHDIQRFGSMTSPMSTVSVDAHPLSRWVLITITVCLLFVFLVLTLMKDPLRIFREEPPGLSKGTGLTALPAGNLDAGTNSMNETLSLWPGRVTIPPNELQISIHHPDSRRIPPLQIQGLADGHPPTCWVPHDAEEQLVLDGGKVRSWSHLLLHRCSLPGANTAVPPELTVKVHTADGSRSRVLRLRAGNAPTRVDLGGQLAERFLLTLHPVNSAAGLSGIVAYYFEESGP